VNNGIFVQNLLDKPSSDIGLPKGLPSTNLVALPYNYPGDDYWRIDKNSVVFVVDTRYGSDTSVTIPSIAGTNLIVDWGDGTTRLYSLGTTYIYANHGIYIIKIIGTVTSIGGNIPTTNLNRLKTIKCLSFGNTLTSLPFAFSNPSNIGHPNLIEAPSTLPNSCTSLLRCFAGCSKFDDPNIRNWDTKNITNISSIFNGANLFNQDISSWNVGNVTDMSFAFQVSRFNQPIGSWDVSKVTNFSAMFNLTPFNQDISNWNTSAATNMSSMFQNTPLDQPIGNWNVSNVTSFSNMFFSSSVTSPFNQDLSSWSINTNPSASVSMDGMFRGVSVFNNLSSSGINNWNTSRVTAMNNMFNAAFAFNQPLDNWDVSNVTNMNAMFANCPNFNQNIGSWDVSKVTNFSQMFQSATSFNSSLSGWQLVANNVNCADMFRNATNFQGIGLDSWNTSGVTNMLHMFSHIGVNSFNENISGWDVSNVTNFAFMFWSSNINLPFNQNLGSWSVSKGTTFQEMFRGCVSVSNQDLRNWNIAGVNVSNGLDNFMLGKTEVNSLSTANYDALLIGWNNNKLAAANGVANWRTDLRPHFGGAKYTAGGDAATARADLISYGWTITDGGIA
jgi:surface protein